VKPRVKEWWNDDNTLEKASTFSWLNQLQQTVPVGVEQSERLQRYAGYPWKWTKDIDP